MKNLRNLAKDVENIHRFTDQLVQAFAQASGLRCPLNCGFCCTVDHVEASELEMLPAALYLYDQGVRLASMQKFLIERGHADCYFYLRESPEGALGRCSLYQCRGTLCRLFGFMQRNSKDGSPELLVCKTLRQDTDKSILGKVQESITSGKMSAPNIATIQARMSALEPFLAHPERHINRALEKALARIETQEAYKAQSLGFDVLSYNEIGTACGEA